MKPGGWEFGKLEMGADEQSRGDSMSFCRYAISVLFDLQ
jgi:hypothetical protein